MLCVSYTCVSPSVYSWVASKGSIQITMRSCSICPPSMLVWIIHIENVPIQILSLHLLSVLLHLDVAGWPAHRTPQTLPKQSSVQEKLSSYHWTSPCICTEWPPSSGYCHLWESMSPSVTGSFAPSNVFPLLRSPKSALFLTRKEGFILIFQL